MSEYANILKPSIVAPAAVTDKPFPVHQSSQDFLFNRSGKSLPIQCKLSVGPVDDPLEQEADAMADRVMRMPEPNLIQRKCSQCEEEEEQRKPTIPFIQKKESDGKSTVSDAVHHRIQSAKGGGSALPHQTKSFMESRFGTDFSGVRIHSGDYASELSTELNAQAFTVGNDIYFNSGKFSPGSSAGKHLLAHELSHTVQQKGMNGIIQKAPITDTGKIKSSEGKFDPLIGMYTVAVGDNLSKIASRFSTTVAEIQKNNPDIKDPGKISVGQKIFLPDLIMPLDPVGMKHKEISFDDYVKKWEAEKGRPITTWEETQLKKGCVGISAINTGMKPLDNLDSCYDTFEHALKLARDKNEALKKAGNTTMKNVIFSMRFWSGGKPYAPDVLGKINMTDYKSRLNSGDAWRPDDASGSDYINFDFGFYEVETGMWWHANHKHDPGGMGPMKAFESSLDYYSKPLLDFDRQIFCVVAKTI